MSKGDGPLFLSKEWVSKAVAEIEWAKKHDEELRRKTAEFTLRVVYVVHGIPDELRRIYGSDSLAIFIGLDRGRLTEFRVAEARPGGEYKDVDYTIRSSYDVVKKIFRGDMTVVEAYMNREVKVEPFRKLYLNPRFTAKSITVVSMLLRILRDRLHTIYI